MVILSKKGSPEIKETYEERVKRMNKEGLGSITREQSHALAEAVNMKPIKTSKSKLKKDIEDTIKMVESVKIPKPIKQNKNISKTLEIAELITKTPKIKKMNMKKETESIHDTMAEIDKLLKAPKKDLKKLVKADKEHIKYHPSEQDKKELKMDNKIMQHSKGYKHKVKNISPIVHNYVEQWKDIVINGKTPSSIGSKLNKLQLNLYTKMRPSDVSDANALIQDFMKSLPSKESKSKTKKEPKTKTVDKSYSGDKKYKSLILYVIKHKPHITDPEVIDVVVQELIDKNIPRMSVKKLDEVLKELDIDV